MYPPDLSCIYANYVQALKVTADSLVGSVADLIIVFVDEMSSCSSDVGQCILHDTVGQLKISVRGTTSIKYTPCTVYGMPAVPRTR